MTKQLTFLLFIGVFYQTHAQIVRRSIVGRIGNDSISVESIHIVNKNTKKGTISNKYGMFKIPVKVNDTLVFDGIQFQKKELRITKKMLRNRTLDVALIQKINKLQTIEIKNINLSGELLNDAKKVKKPISMVSKNALDFGKIDFNVVDDIDAIDRQKAPNPYGGDASLRFNAGANLLGLVSFMLNPAIKVISKIGQRKRKLKKAKKEYHKIALTVPNKIRAELGDAFFVNQLKIPKNKIDAFIIYCRPKGVVDLYMNSKKIELIQVLMSESKDFNKD